jgi:hypothetical protein
MMSKLNDVTHNVLKNLPVLYHLASRVGLTPKKAYRMEKAKMSVMHTLNDARHSIDKGMHELHRFQKEQGRALHRTQKTVNGKMHLFGRVFALAAFILMANARRRGVR